MHDERAVTSATASPAGHTLRALGAFELLDAKGEVVFSSGKPLAVLAYLACARGQRASRQGLVELLWGDSDPERGRACLRQALFALRQRLGIDWIVADGEWLVLIAPMALDAREFLDAVEQSNHADAIARYAGDFVPDFAAPGAAEFEGWADTERRRLRGAFLAAARSEVRAQITRGESAPAVELSGRLRDADPDDDEHWRIRFEALALAGRFAVIDLEESALRASRADDGRAVDAGTEMILRRLRRAATDARQASPVSAPVSSRIPADPEFQGRAEVFAHVLSAWGLACRGRAQRRTIVAGAGLGKTRLLKELARRLAAQRARVVHASARQGERDDAFGFLAEIVARVAELSGASGIAPASASVLAGLVPVLADTFNVKPEAGVQDAGELLRRRALAFADLIGAVADDRPLALLADDLQWADAASIQALDRAFARVPRVPLLLVSASRTEQADTGAVDERLTLPPLGRDEVAMLISSIAVAEPPGWSETLTARIHVASGGSPFAVLQFLRLAMERSVIRVTGDYWEVPDEAAVQPLLDRAATVEWRLRLLEDADLEALTCLALCDQPVTEAQLAAACTGGAQRLRESLFRLESDAFVVHGALDTWRIAHDLVAEGALAIASADMQRRCAGRMGEELGKSVSASDVAAVRRVMRLHLDAQREDAALHFLREWLAQQPRNAYAPLHIAALLPSGHYDAAFEARARTLLRRRRRWWNSRSFLAAASTAITLVVVALALLRPVALVITSTPDPTEGDRPEAVYEVSPRIELRNALGRVTSRRDGDSVQMAPAHSGRVLRGQPFAVLQGGVAVFDSVYPSVGVPPNSEPVQDFRFTLRGVEPLVLIRRNRADSLAIVESTLNGHRSPDDVPLVRVRPGEPIRGTVRMRYTTRARDILYVLAQAATWGVGERDTLTVRSILAGVSGATFTFPVDVRAPTRAGNYWILWTQGTEPSASWLFSGTNWKCGKPAWNDGNDVAAMADSVLTEAVRTRSVMVLMLLCDDGFSRTMRRLPLAGVRVEVR